MSWKRFFHRQHWEQERARELDQYLEFETAENIARGMSADEAAAAAHRKLGNTTLVREEIYRMNSLGFLETIWQDIRYGVRTLLKTPGFTLVAVLTLALGIGANSAMFSVVNGVVLRPLPYQDPSRLFMLWTDLHHPSYAKIEVSAPEYVDFRDNSPSFSGVAGFTSEGMTLTGRGDAESLIICPATPNLFSVLGVHPLHGRTFTAEEATPGHDHVAVLSYEFWENHFGADPRILGQAITLDEWSYTVIGVMPRNFAFPDRDTQIWRPQVLTTNLLSENNRGSHFLQSVARLTPDVTLRQAEAQLAALSDRMGRDHPQTYPRGYSAHLTLLQSEIVGDAPRALWILLAAVGVVLLIACANIANLLLARASVRRREVALRGALGASRLRLIRQFLTESSLLALGGGIVGLLLARLGVPVLLRLGDAQVPRADEIHADLTVVLFTCAVAVGTVLFFGLIPALESSFVNVQTALKEGGAHTAHSSRSGMRSLLVVAQMAAALVLLVGAGLLARSFLNVTRVNSGFAPSRLLTFRVPITSNRYPGFIRRAAFYSELLQRFSDHPGVQSVAAINSLPFSGYGGDRSFLIEGQPVSPGQAHQDEQLRFISPNYFRTMGIPLLRGRDFSVHDNPDSFRVVIVNQAFVDRYWPGETGLGKHISYSGFRDNKPNWREIIGVAGNIHHNGLETEQQPEAYIPMLQPLFGLSDSVLPNMFLAVRTSANPAEFVAQAHAELAKLDPETPMSNLMTMEDRITASQSSRRFQTLLLGIFAIMALLLAAIGIYGVTAYAAQQRQQEFGVRIALGAQPAHILKLVLETGGRLVLMGVVFGLVLAAAFARVLATLLFQVAPIDPVTFSVAVAFLAAVALLGCCIPARRAMRADPIAALRSE